MMITKYDYDLGRLVYPGATRSSACPHGWTERCPHCMEGEINRLRAELPQGPPVSGLKTPPELLALIERAKNHVMSPEEIYEQRRSFTRGMCPSNRDYKEWCEEVDRILPPLSVTRPLRGGES